MNFSEDDDGMTSNDSAYNYIQYSRTSNGLWEILLVFILFIAMVFGNGLVIIAFIVFKKLQSQKTNYLTLNLAVSDFLFGVLVMPFKLRELRSQFWNLGTTLCLLLISCEVFLNFVSILCLVVIIIDKYCNIQYPFMYINIVKMRTIQIAVFSTWIIPFTVTFIPNMSGYTCIPDYPLFIENNICVPLFEEWWVICGFVLGFMIPFLILAYTNQRLFRIVSNQAKRVCIQSQTSTYPICFRKAQFRAIKGTAIIVVLFCIMWLPYYITKIILAFYPTSAIVIEIHFYSSLLAYCNAAINPLLYAYNKDFQRAYRKLLCCDRHFICL
ncbi:D(1A) dopamine receptor-like [Glandiceps talaboti]